jgi:tRNA pseudouridine38-40 synthase
MYNYLLVLSYIGANYKGWQIQKNGEKTVQGLLVDILKKALNVDIIKMSYTGRTDSGVNALFQHFNFFCSKKFSKEELEKALIKINNFSPSDIFVFYIKNVDLSFSSRYNAIKKTYLYKLISSKDKEFIFEKYGFYNFLPIPLYDKEHLVNKLDQIIPYFNGEKDYSSYYKPDKEVNKNTVLYLTTKYYIYSLEEFLIINLEFTAKYFLRNMIRKIVGMIVNFILDYVDLEFVEDTFKDLDPSKGKFIASPEPLVLYKVENNFN